MTTKLAFVFLIVLLLVIETLPKHLPPILRKTIVDAIDEQIEDTGVVIHQKSSAVRAFLDRMDKDAHVVGRPRYVQIALNSL